jgi:hypothetical protein
VVWSSSSLIAGAPTLLIATAFFTACDLGFAISLYIAACSAVSLVSASLPDYTGKDISSEHDD